MQYEESQADSRRNQIKHLREELDFLQEHVRDGTFKMDEIQVKSIKFERKHEETSKLCGELQLKNSYLVTAEATYKEENEKLQKR
jgi:chromosome segregation ATPase